MNNFRSMRIVLEPSPGALRSMCCLEAVEIAIKYDCTVEFTYNGQILKVTQSDILAAVKVSSD